MKLVAIDGRCPHCGTDSRDLSAIGLIKNMTIADKDTAIQSLRGQLAAAQDERDALQADNARLRGALTKAIEFVPAGYGIERECWNAIHATPEQSLDALLDPYKTHIERLRELLTESVDLIETLTPLEGPTERKARAALAATPEQSLARIRNQVREECADACEEYQGSAETCATRIRAMKEPE